MFVFVPKVSRTVCMWGMWVIGYVRTVGLRGYTEEHVRGYKIGEILKEFDKYRTGEDRCLSAG